MCNIKNKEHGTWAIACSHISEHDKETMYLIICKKEEDDGDRKVR